MRHICYSLYADCLFPW